MYLLICMQPWLFLSLSLSFLLSLLVLVMGGDRVVILVMESDDWSDEKVIGDSRWW